MLKVIEENLFINRRKMLFAHTQKKMKLYQCCIAKEKKTIS